MGILATSYGLLRTITDIRTADVAWRKITLPEASGSSGITPVTRLFGIRAEQDNIYLLNAQVSLGQTFVYRIAIDGDSVRLLPDYFVAEMPFFALSPYILAKPKLPILKLFTYWFFKKKQSFFLDLGGYRNYFTTDGSFMIVSRSASGKTPAFLQLLPPSLKSGNPLINRSVAQFLPAMEKARTMGPLVRNSSSGAWMVTGDFGVRQLKGNNS